MGEGSRRPAVSVILLLAAAMFINYVDRGNLSTAAPVLKDALGLDNSRIGLLLSVFFWLYIPCQFLAGWLVGRFPAWKLLAAGFALWSAATILTGFAGSFPELLALRVLLGLGESVILPCFMALIAEQVPVERLGLANGLSFFTLSLGPALGTFAGALVVESYGWRALFTSFGVLGSIWLLPWWLLMPGRRSASPAPAAHSSLSYGRIARCPILWAVTAAESCGDYVLYFLLGWLPLYLVKEHGLSEARMGLVGGMLFLLIGAIALLTGWGSDRLIARGRAAGKIRKGMIVTAYAGTALCLLLVVQGTAAIQVPALFGAGLFMGLCPSALWSITQTFAGPRASGKWVGVQNGVASLAGALSPLLTGSLIDGSGGFPAAFLLAAAFSLVGAAIWWLIPAAAPIDWELEPGAA